MKEETQKDLAYLVVDEEGNFAAAFTNKQEAQDYADNCGGIAHFVHENRCEIHPHVCSKTHHTRQISHEYGLLEFDVSCVECGKVLNTWAYGQYQHDNTY